ncbi:hypothetical protein GCM10010222_27170 [Streptomyces tanashiensis]|nr:hypothetical protein GCM10010222_27170 [Streptomyces tanashiensis]
MSVAVVFMAELNHPGEGGRAAPPLPGCGPDCGQDTALTARLLAAPLLLSVLAGASPGCAGAPMQGVSDGGPARIDEYQHVPTSNRNRHKTPPLTRS